MYDGKILSGAVFLLPLIVNTGTKYMGMKYTGMKSTKNMLNNSGNELEVKDL